MGEHGTWFDYLNRFEWWRHADHWAKAKLGRTSGLGMFETGWTLTHVLIALVVIAFCAWGALAFFRGTQTQDEGLVPPRTMNLRNFFEYTAESVYGMVEGAMGEKNAARFFPLVGALWLFILFCNLIGLIPGFVAPTDTVKTNLGLALMVFLLTHAYGVKEHGLAYFKHFLGPSPFLIPLMLPIEIISHLARPLSLTIRLMGVLRAGPDPDPAAVPPARPAGLPDPGARVLHADDGLHRHGGRARARRSLTSTSFFPNRPALPIIEFALLTTASRAPIQGDPS